MIPCIKTRRPRLPGFRELAKGPQSRDLNNVSWVETVRAHGNRPGRRYLQESCVYTDWLSASSTRTSIRKGRKRIDQCSGLHPIPQPASIVYRALHCHKHHPGFSEKRTSSSHRIKRPCCLNPGKNARCPLSKPRPITLTALVFLEIVLP